MAVVNQWTSRCFPCFHYNLELSCADGTYDYENGPGQHHDVDDINCPPVGNFHDSTELDDGYHEDQAVLDGDRYALTETLDYVGEEEEAHPLGNEVGPLGAQNAIRPQVWGDPTSDRRLMGSVRGPTPSEGSSKAPRREFILTGNTSTWPNPAFHESFSGLVQSAVQPFQQNSRPSQILRMWSRKDPGVLRTDRYVLEARLKFVTTGEPCVIVEQKLRIHGVPGCLNFTPGGIDWLPG
ncbi:hypothetical protein B0H14DRAFT_2620895 [Mycena olivaceomarginata]|nr:hypothetical protein B0H14DRAFT_2620895 [Mycena olivaceomarginata]